MSTFKNFINGQFVEAADGQTTAVIDPSTGEVYAQASLSGAADVDTAMKAAGKAFTSWSQTTPSERSLALYRIADAIEAHADEIVAAEVKNTGKPIALTSSEEIPPMVDQIRFFAGAARMLEGKATAEYMANMTSMIRREPVGVCDSRCARRGSRRKPRERGCCLAGARSASCAGRALRAFAHLRFRLGELAGCGEAGAVAARRGPVGTRLAALDWPARARRAAADAARIQLGDALSQLKAAG